MSTVAEIALETARARLTKIYADITAATSVIPKSVSQGPYQKAVKWKPLAAKWRAKVAKGIPKTNDIKELDELASEANYALNQIKTGDV